jgi:hypothetical protein
MLYRSPIAHHQLPAVIPLVNAVFDLPVLAITRAWSDQASTLRLPPLTALTGRGGRLEAAAAHSLTQGLAVVGFVRHPLLRTCTGSATFLRDPDRSQGCFRPLTLIRLHTGHIQAHRHTMSLSYPPSFGALARFGLADFRSPFVVSTNLPSQNACAHASLP